MDFTGRRQSTNVDDRRKNWRIYEAFRPLRPQPEVVADNRHSQAVDRAAQAMLDENERPIRVRRPGGGHKPRTIETQEEFDRLLAQDSERPTPDETPSIIRNLLRK